ncbi:DUF3592 domain-containing protein [Streptomyces mirabilis]|uniref:DUF3592 domain-containing protein n=1 Tax=Streptomyces mirabilis TaxID=68239 RepID=UPI0036DCEA2E
MGGWTTFRLHTRGQRIEAEIVGVRESADGDGDPRFHPEVAFTSPDSDEIRCESKVGRLYPIDRPKRIRVRYDTAKPRRGRLEGYGGPGLLASLVSVVGMTFLGRRHRPLTHSRSGRHRPHGPPDVAWPF